jgi:acetoacetyl-[acyl-carrier protein] synthase
LSRLPVIVGFGGVNPAGRSSAHHGYRRLVIDRLSSDLADDTFASLAALMNMPEVNQSEILKHTLVRKLEKNLFDPDAIRINKSAKLGGNDGTPLSFTLRQNQLPESLPQNWQVTTRRPGTRDLR